MKIALTGATGFLGRYIIAELVAQGHQVRAWYRQTSDRAGFSAEETEAITWVEGELGLPSTAHTLVTGCDAVVHAAVDHPGGTFQGGEGDLSEYVRVNVLGSNLLMEAARSAGVERFIYISSGAVHDKIFDDRPLDETHPLRPKSHYGAQKAAVEQFIHAYGLGGGWKVCALRPCAIYGLAQPPAKSKWFGLISKIVRDDDVEVHGAGKVVHAADVARAAKLLLEADEVAGEVFSCCDRSVSEFEIATLAKQLAGSRSKIIGEPAQAKHEISTSKLQGIGMRFGGTSLLTDTIQAMVRAARQITT